LREPHLLASAPFLPSFMWDRGSPESPSAVSAASATPCTLVSAADAPAPGFLWRSPALLSRDASLQASPLPAGRPGKHAETSPQRALTHTPSRLHSPALGTACSTPPAPRMPSDEEPPEGTFASILAWHRARLQEPCSSLHAKSASTAACTTLSSDCTSPYAWAAADVAASERQSPLAPHRRGGHVADAIARLALRSQSARPSAVEPVAHAWRQCKSLRSDRSEGRAAYDAHALCGVASDREIVPLECCELLGSAGHARGA